MGDRKLHLTAASAALAAALGLTACERQEAKAPEPPAQPPAEPPAEPATAQPPAPTETPPPPGERPPEDPTVLSPPPPPPLPTCPGDPRCDGKVVTR